MAGSNAHRDAQTGAMRALVAGLVAGGVRHAVVAPGSRSTPITLALARHGAIDVSVVLDERSAAFRALGIGRGSGQPAVAVCTSGSAAAHFHPAVLEASHGRVPLIVATADRPPELQDTGAGQTIDQSKLYGNAVRWFAAPGIADAATISTFAPIAARAVAAALGPPAGPVHLNLALREPLVPTQDWLAGDSPARDSPAGEGSADGERAREGAAGDAVVLGPSTVREPVVPGDDLVADLAGELLAAERGLIVAGWGVDAPGGVISALARDLGWPLLADAISGCRVGPNAVSTYEALLRIPRFADEHRPDLVLQFGAPLTSRTAMNVLGGPVPGDGPQHVIVDPDQSWLDPARAATKRIVAPAGALAGRLSLRLGGGGFSAAKVPPSQWLAGWLDAERRARRAIDSTLDSDEVAGGARVARDLAVGLPDGVQLLVASSMPVRELEWFAPARAGLTVHANRGVNGIDGLVSTAIGIAQGSGQPTVALLGDLAFLHDTNGLLGAASAGVNLTLVVVDDDGGAIFSFLPQAQVCSEDEFEWLFGTPHGLDLAAVADAHGVEGVPVARVGEVVETVRRSLAVGDVRVVVARADRHVTVAHHRALWDAVADAITP